MGKPDLNTLSNATKLYREVEDNRIHTMVLSIYNKMLRFNISSAMAKDFSDYKFLFQVALPQISLRMVINEIKDLPSQDVGYEAIYLAYGAKFENNVRVDGKSLNCKIILRRVNYKNKGVINVIQIVTNIDVKYTFFLEPSPYLGLTINGEKDETLISDKFTKSYAETLRGVADYFPECWDVIQERKF